MMELGAAYLATAIKLLEQTEHESQYINAVSDVRPEHIELVEDINRTCLDLRFYLSSQQAQRLLNKLSGHQDIWSSASLKDEFAILKIRIIDELRGRRLFYLNPEEAQIYNLQIPPTVSTKLSPAAADDFAEAGKCVALGRYTASVFHLMRTLEATVRAFAAKVNAVIDNPNWHNVLTAINKEIIKMPISKQEEYAVVSAHLYNVKVAWRNPTMHDVSVKYTEEDAREIFLHTQAFISSLASLL